MRTILIKLIIIFSLSSICAEDIVVQFTAYEGAYIKEKKHGTIVTTHFYFAPDIYISANPREAKTQYLLDPIFFKNVKIYNYAY